MANTGKKNFTGVPFGSNLYMVNPRYHNNFSTITYNGSTYPIKNILNLDKGNNAIEVEYDFNGSPMKEWITPAKNFWATNIPTDNQASIQQTGYTDDLMEKALLNNSMEGMTIPQRQEYLDAYEKEKSRAQMMATRGIGTGTFTGGELQPMTNYRSSIWDYKAPSIKGPAEDIDKVMLGTLGLGIAPVAIPEVATALSTMSIPFEQTIANALSNPYVQAGLTSAFAAGAAQEMPHTLQNTSAAREEFMRHPSWYTGLNYAGELGKLGLDVSMFTPPTKALVQGGKQAYNFLKPSIDNASLYLQDKFPALFDPYTSWDATMGYWGDDLASRTLGTVGRKFGLSPTSQVPEFHRRLSLKDGNAFRVTEDGKIILSSDRVRDGHSGIVNMTTSEPARSHNHHKFLSGYDDFIINPKALEGQNFLSIQPSDTFFRTGEFSVKPEYLTFVSGNPELLDRAQQLGMKTLSSPTLRKLVAEGSSLPNVDGPISIRMFKAYDNAPLVGKEIQRLTSMRGAPTMKDYAAFEENTGLNSGVVPNTQENYSDAVSLFGRVGKTRQEPTFNNVIYDPASSIEGLYREAITTGEQEAWNKYWNALRRMPSAKSQLEGKGLYDTSISLPEHTLGESKIEQLSRNLNESIEDTALNVGEPTGGVVRTKLGDVEIDNPALAYRQGNTAMGDDFINTGEVKLPMKSHFKNPIFNQGSLFYKSPIEGFSSFSEHPKSDLLVSTAKMLPSDNHGFPIPAIRTEANGDMLDALGFTFFDGLRIPAGKGAANSTNTYLYRWDPNYGYRKVTQEPPTIDWPTSLAKGEVVTRDMPTKMQTINISPEELYKVLQEQEGYYFLGHGTGRNPSASEAIFNSGLRTKTGDVSDTTIPLSESNLASWPHLNSEEIVILPGKVENVKYDYPYGKIPTDWFDNNTFNWNDNPGFSGRGLLAQENPHASFTESIVDGVPGVYTKPEAVLGTYNTKTHTLQINPNSQYKFPFSETSIVPKIAEENAVTDVTDAPDALASFEPDSPISISSQLIKDAYRRYNPTWGFDVDKYYDINRHLNLDEGVYKGINIDFPRIEIPEIKVDWRDLVTPEGRKLMDDAHTFLEELSEPLDFTTASKTPAGKTAAAIRKADQDIDEMNTYHSANVEEYNRATGSNVVSRPFRTDRIGRNTRILPKSEFEKEVGGMKTNSPTDDVRNIGGLYSRKDDTTYLRDKTRASTAYHEFLHSNDYGETNPEVTEWRIGQLVDPEKIANLSEREKRYFLSNAEFPVYLRQFGESLGIKVGQPYPGDFAFDLLMFNQNGKGIGGATAYAKGTDITSSTEDKQLLWRALNGTLFGTTAAAILGTAYGLSNNDSNVQALGGPLVRMANMFDNGGYKYYMKPSDAGYYAPEVRVTPSGSGPAAILENGDYGVTAGTLNYMGVPIYEGSKELNDNQYRTQPTNAEASHLADNMVSATEFKPQHLLTAPLQGLMPLNISNWIGLADEDNNMGLAYLYSDKNPGFFIGNDPTKPFSKKFAQEHPYWAMSGNLIGDALGTLGVGKTLKTGYGKITSAYDDAKYHIDAFRENWANPYVREDMKNGLSDFWHLWKNSIKNPKQGRVLGAYTTKSYPYTGAGMYEYSAERPGRASINLGGMNTKLKDFNWDFKPETIGHYYGADGTVTSGTADDLLQAGIEGWEPIYVDPKKIDVGALKRDIEGLPSRVGVRGDANSNTLGQQLALDYSKGNYKDMLLHFMHNTGDFNPVRVPKRGWYNVPVLGAENSAQSPAAEAMLYGMRLKNPWKFDLRYSTHPAGNFNNYATGINRPIYEAEQAYLAGNMSAEDYVELYNKWLEGIEGKFNVHNLPQDQLMRRAYVDKSGKVVKPQAWLIRKDYGGPLVQMANRYEMGGPKKKYEPYYGIYGNVSPYIGEGAPILQYDVDSDEWYSDTWSDDSKRVKQERGWYKNAPQSFKDNYWMVVDPNGDKIKYVSPEKYKAGSDWYNGRSPIFGSGSWSDNSNSYANPFEEEKIIDGKVVWPEEGEFYIDGQQIYTDGEGGGYTEYEPFTAPNSYDEGGSLNTHKKWEDLSMKERGEMIRVAIRNGITNLSDIKSKYNEFAEGGNLYGGTTQKTQQMQRRSWKTSHQQRWFAFLKRKGLSDADAARLSGFFMAQDGLESAGGTSSAARQKNNYGGMQRNGKNISYPSVEAYMEDKWNMMNSKFRSALGARTIDEYATILGNPNTAGKGYLYYVTDQAKYDPNSPVWRAAQTKHMHNYINGMRSWAGQGSVKFNDNNYSYNQNTWPQGYVYDVLPQLFAMDGVPITVSSGYRPGAVVNGTNTPSKHGMNQAADIVGDFAKIQQVLDNPNSNVSRWMLANGYGYLNETLPEIMEKTGATGKHYHIGSDSYLARQYADKFKNASPQFYEQPQGTMVPPLTPYNQEAFYGQNNTSNNQALIDMMNSIQDQYNAYQEDVRRKELAQQEAAIKQQRMQGLSTLLSMFGSMNQDEGTSPYSYMSNMLTMMPT